jgi:hypothetical protein
VNPGAKLAEIASAQVNDRNGSINLKPVPVRSTKRATGGSASSRKPPLMLSLVAGSGPRPSADVTLTDREMTALTAAGAIASLVIEPENCRMTASSCLVARYSIGFSKTLNQQGW